MDFCRHAFIVGSEAEKELNDTNSDTWKAKFEALEKSTAKEITDLTAKLDTETKAHAETKTSHTNKETNAAHHK